MSWPSHGEPVDDIDAVCKEYKNCLKCVRMQHGEMCIPEFAKVILLLNIFTVIIFYDTEKLFFVKKLYQLLRKNIFV